ncbi:MAG: hypothetical protein IJD39_12595 [Clostridia bacterium]|nr:hypothetical protein [Clostridia bacterium]
MRKHQQLPLKQFDKKQKYIIPIAALIMVILLIMTVMGAFNGGKRTMSAHLLRCVATQNVTPFGNSILYYDGMTLVCLNSRGGERWSYPLGENATFSCSDSVIAAWSGTQLHIINQDGHSTYNENLADEIQFARVGSRYVGVVLGDSISPSLVIKDMQGTSIDNETAAYTDMAILDIGFFGDGEYFWTTSMNVYGTTPTTILHTFRVNMSNSGEISLGDNLPYAIVYAGNELNIISTRQLRQFDYRGTQDASGTKLVYGWQLVDDQVSGNQAMLLFAPIRQIENGIAINQLRLLNGDTDKRFTLPSTCVGAMLYNKKIYAFSSDTLYRADISGRRFNAISLPSDMNGAIVTSYLGMLKNGIALVACDNDVYAVTLP